MPPYSKPRDQIQIVRVPTASTPFNALELHTRFRQNILCDFSDNVAVFRRLCQVMNLDILPQDKPLIVHYPLGANRSYICFVLAPKQAEA